MSNPNNNVAWLYRPVLESLTKEANAQTPKETGGVLMGYFKQPGNIPVILLATNPGPNAMYFRYSYRPDYDYDEALIASVHEKSNERITYLGDWHSHPAPSNKMSYRDKRTLRRIGAYKPALVNEPVMLIVSFSDQWSPTIWQGKLRKRKFLGTHLSIEKKTIHIFE